jgi:hypothetical protein
MVNWAAVAVGLGRAQRGAAPGPMAGSAGGVSPPAEPSQSESNAADDAVWDEIAACAAACPPGQPSGDTAKAWRHFFWARQRDWAQSRHCGEEHAVRVAYGETLNAWHRRHGERCDASRCAGCGGRLFDDALDLADGARVHNGDLCIVRYGRRWQGRAKAALAALGIPAISEWGVQ